MKTTRGVFDLVVLVLLILSLIQSRETWAEGKKVSGTGKGFTVLATTTMSPGDDPKHVVTLSRNVHTLYSANPDFNNLEAQNVAISDYTAGNGPTRGHGIRIHPSGDRWFVAWEGMQKTVPKPAGPPEITFAGKWWSTGGTGRFNGIKGGGTYKGEVTPTGVEYVWEGEYEIKR